MILVNISESTYVPRHTSFWLQQGTHAKVSKLSEGSYSGIVVMYDRYHTVSDH